MELDDKQRLAVDFAVSGHNFLLLGEAGTGKSSVLIAVYNRLRSMGKEVAITCSTGIACHVYKNQKAMTVHRWAGLEDCRYSPEDIQDIVNNNIKYSDVQRRIQETDVLIIDEVSMISKRTLACLEEITALKNKTKYFGGMQVILCGDFYQLPPVKNLCYHDTGDYCFEFDSFNKFFPHRVILDRIHRQNEIEFVKCIQEITRGSLSPESQVFISNLDRELPVSHIETVKLFSTNEMVDDFNRSNILEFGGQLFEFNSVDTGDCVGIETEPKEDNWFCDSCESASNKRRKRRGRKGKKKK